MGATTHRHPTAPHIGVLQQYYYIPQPLNIAYQQHTEMKPSVVTPNQTPPPEKDSEDKVTTPNDKKNVC